eukprot:166542_1
MNTNTKKRKQKEKDVDIDIHGQKRNHKKKRWINLKPQDFPQITANDIANADIEVNLYGISIGTYAHLWTPSHYYESPPSIVLNKFAAYLSICLKNAASETVTIQINLRHIQSLLIAKDASYFHCEHTDMQYLNVAFILVDKPLIDYRWLQTDFCPCDVKAHISKKFITIYINYESLQHLQHIISSNLSCLDIKHIKTISSKDKFNLIKYTVMRTGIVNQWKVMNLNKIKQMLTVKNKNINDNTILE